MNRWILVMAGVLVTLGSLQAAKTADDNWGLDGLTVAEWAAKRQAQEEQQKREAGGQFVNLREVKIKPEAAVYQENEPVNFYTGKPYDADLGYVFQFRNYNPEMQRWTTQDPSGFPDGANNYTYSSKPLRSLDPRGLDVWYRSQGGGHAEIIVTNPASSTGYTSLDYVPTRGGLSEPLKAEFSLGQMIITETGKPNNDDFRTIQIPRTAEQDKAILDRGSEIQGNPGIFEGVTNQCVTNAIDLLNSGGVNVLLVSTGIEIITSPTHPSFFGLLSRLPLPDVLLIKLYVWNYFHQVIYE